MRIISGILRGRTIRAPKDGLRPTMEQAREAVFSSLAMRVPDARVLDLFAGSGSLGLEAWSRGAASVTSVEQESKHCKILQENFQALEGDPDLGRWQTIRADAYDFLKRNTASFDLIFADPPYLEADLPKLLALIGTALAPDGLVIFEMRARGAIEIPESWTLLKDKKYGGTRMLFLQKA